MSLACPSCGAEFTLDVLLAHAETGPLMLQVARVSLPLGGQVDRYLRLFKPPRQKVRMAKVVAVLTELAADLQRGAITRKGRDWQAGRDVFAAAFDEVFKAHDKGTLKPPLADNAYLYEVIVSLSDRAEGVREQAGEHERRAGATRWQPGESARVESPGFTSVEQLLAHRRQQKGGSHA